MSSPLHYGTASLMSSCYFNYFTFMLLIIQGFSIASNVPTFKSLPTTVKTSEHDTVLLPCYVDNLGANAIKWWKDDMLIWDTGNTSLIVPSNVRMFASNNTLEVSDVSAFDTGEYVCQVVRPSPWGPLNQIHAIEVQYPPTVTPMPESSELEVALNEDVIMGCTSTGVPHPVITWSFEGKPIQLLTNRPTLTFKVTDKIMAGEYQCTANNGVGEPAIASILLKVTYPPVVLTDKIWIHTAPGLRADLSCNVIANPDAKVEWEKDGRLVDIHSTRIVPVRINDKHMLIIRNVRATDLGYYTCKASNGIGKGQQSMQLSGLPNTAIFKKYNKQLNKHNITLIWEVDSYSPIIEYSLLFREYQLDSQPREWTKLVIPADPDNLGPLHTQSYTLSALKSSTVYEAGLLSRNRFGWSRPTEIYSFKTSGSDGDIDDDQDDIEDVIVDKNILTVDEEIDRNTIQTVMSADFDVTYNTESMTSLATRLCTQYTSSVISGVCILVLYFIT